MRDHSSVLLIPRILAFILSWSNELSLEYDKDVLSRLSFQNFTVENEAAESQF